MLAYEPTNTNHDGGFRRIEVRLPNRRALRVRTRSGYFAPDDRRARATAAAIEDQTRRAEQRRTEMTTALRALAPLTAIPVRLSAEFVSLDGGEGQVLVAGDVDVATLPFVRLGERRQATVEAVAVVNREEGEAAATLETERTAMNLTEADYESMKRNGLPYRRTIALPPGRYQVRLAVREDATGLLGSAWRWVDVPDLSANRLALSGLFLLKEDGASTAASGAPAASDAAPPLRSVQGRPRFDRTESLYVQLYAYGPKRDATGACELVAQAEVLRNGAVLATAAPELMTPDAPGTPVLHLSRIRLQRFAPGDYQLRITVTDRKAGAAVARSVPFTVE